MIFFHKDFFYKLDVLGEGPNFPSKDPQVKIVNGGPISSRRDSLNGSPKRYL